MSKPVQPILESVPIAGPVSVTVREFNLPGFTFPWHRHPEVELTLIREGSGLRYVGDSVESFQAGDFCLIGSNLPHAWHSVGDSKHRQARSLVVQFDPNRLGDLMALPELARVRSLLNQAARGMQFDATVGQELCVRLEPGKEPILQLTALIEVLHVLAGRSELARPLSSAIWPSGTDDAREPQLARVLTYLREHIGESFGQAEVARMTGLSPAAFSRFFKSRMGKTFQSYVTDLRLGMACRYLQESSYSVSETAFASGFGNLSNFNRRFRERHGMSPKAYRRASAAR